MYLSSSKGGIIALLKKLYYFKNCVDKLLSFLHEWIEINLDNKIIIQDIQKLNNHLW